MLLEEVSTAPWSVVTPCEDLAVLRRRGLCDHWQRGLEDVTIIVASVAGSVAVQFNRLDPFNTIEIADLFCCQSNLRSKGATFATTRHSTNSSNNHLISQNLITQNNGLLNTQLPLWDEDTDACAWMLRASDIAVWGGDVLQLACRAPPSETRGLVYDVTLRARAKRKALV